MIRDTSAVGPEEEIREGVQKCAGVVGCAVGRPQGVVADGLYRHLVAWLFCLQAIVVTQGIRDLWKKGRA